MSEKIMLDESAVISAYEECETTRLVAEEFGVSDETIRRVLIRNGIKRTHRHDKSEKPKAWCKVAQCYKGKHCRPLVVMLRTVLDLNYSELAQATNIPGSSVNDILRKYGLLAAKPPTKHVVDMDALEREYLDGASTYTLAEKYGVCHTTISGWMKERGHQRGRGNFKPGTEAALNVAEGSRKAHEKLSENAKTRFLETYGDASASVEKHRRAQFVRKKRILERPRDLGINWRTVAERQGNMKCSICGCECNPNDKRWGFHGPTYPSVDHIRRIADGGSDTWDNVRLTCMHCNIKLSAVMRNAKKQTA